MSGSRNESGASQEPTFSASSIESRAEQSETEALLPDTHCCAHERYNLRRGLEHPQSSWAAMVFQGIVLVLIILSTLTSILVTVEELSKRYKFVFWISEVFFTFAFTAEIAVRFFASLPSWRSYLCSPGGVVDIVATLPWYIEMIYASLSEAGSQGENSRLATNLRLLRVLRVSRMIRLMKAARHSEKANIIVESLQSSTTNLIMLVGAVMVGTVFSGTAIYAIESGDEFPNIPVAMWWAITTITTVGYGDFTPKSVAGQIIGSCTMVGGVLTISLSMAIVATTFTEEYTRRTEAKKARDHTNKRLLRHCTAESVEFVLNKLASAEEELSEALELIELTLSANDDTPGKLEGMAAASALLERKNAVQTRQTMMLEFLRGQSHTLFVAAKGWAHAAAASIEVNESHEDGAAGASGASGTYSRTSTESATSALDA